MLRIPRRFKVISEKIVAKRRNEIYEPGKIDTDRQLDNYSAALNELELQQAIQKAKMSLPAMKVTDNSVLLTADFPVQILKPESSLRVFGTRLYDLKIMKKTRNRLVKRYCQPLLSLPIIYYVNNNYDDFIDFFVTKLNNFEFLELLSEVCGSEVIEVIANVSTGVSSYLLFILLRKSLFNLEPTPPLFFGFDRKFPASVFVADTGNVSIKYFDKPKFEDWKLTIEPQFATIQNSDHIYLSQNGQSNKLSYDFYVLIKTPTSIFTKFRLRKFRKIIEKQEKGKLRINLKIDKS